MPLEIRTYRKLPVEIQAVQVSEGNIEAIQFWIRDSGQEATTEAPYWLRIETLEGQMVAKVGDWVICGIKGEFYPCAPDIFAGSYEEV